MKKNSIVVRKKGKSSFWDRIRIFLQLLNNQYENRKDEKFIEEYSERYIRRKGYSKF